MLRIFKTPLQNMKMFSQLQFFKSETGEKTANGGKIFRNWKLVKGDNVFYIYFQVIMISGREKNKTGVITKVYKNRN